ncbi:LemA family protein [Roseococcus sp. YIM B11640]|uniref:LemA family protein n=1 Tax=Roseococcus sp. YIM B11640 TaxID=3133973 RepID=UPI003C7D8035
MEWAIPAVVVLLLIWLMVVYNRLVALRQVTNQSWSDIEVQLKQRHDLIPNLVETVKGYAAHESKTLDAVVKARNVAASAQSPDAIGKAEGALTAQLGRIFALAESYPDLKADAGFRQLQSELGDLENKIAAARRFFNNSAQEYNTARLQFPAVFIASNMGFHSVEYYAVPESEREAVQSVPAVKF